MHESAAYLTELNELLHSGAHWSFEIISDLVIAVPAYIWGKARAVRWVNKHDKEVHGEPSVHEV